MTNLKLFKISLINTSFRKVFRFVKKNKAYSIEF